MAQEIFTNWLHLPKQQPGQIKKQYYQHPRNITHNHALFHPLSTPRVITVLTVIKISSAYFWSLSNKNPTACPFCVSFPCIFMFVKFIHIVEYSIKLCPLLYIFLCMIIPWYLLYCLLYLGNFQVWSYCKQYCYKYSSAICKHTHIIGRCACICTQLCLVCSWERNYGFLEVYVWFLQVLFSRMVVVIYNSTSSAQQLQVPTFLPTLNHSDAIGVKIWILISMMTCEAEHIFITLLVICIFFLISCLSLSFSFFLMSCLKKLIYIYLYI